MISQIVAVTAINLRSLPHRLWTSLSAILASAVVVGVLLAFLAMANGFRATVAGAGSDQVAIIMRPASQSELNSILRREQVSLIAQAPGIARRDGKPLVSPEVYVIVDGIKKTTGLTVNLPMRGVEPTALAVRDNIHLVAGRMFEPGRSEIIVGRAVLDEFAGFELGSTLTYGNSRWTVVGIFDAGGTVFESEVWADAKVVQNLFNRGSTYQIVRARLTSPAALEKLKAYLDADPRLKLEARSERDYLAEQAQGMSKLIETLGWPIAITMAIGALAGALNTMYASVAARTREIGTLRAIGFSGVATFVGTLVESLLLTAGGGVIGAVAAVAFFQNMTASTLGSSFTQVVFRFELTPELVLQGVSLAVVVGLLGGIFPAFRAARIPVVVAFGER